MTVVVALVSQKGGVGKSTLARSLAALCARGGLTVKLADLDTKQQTAVKWAEVRAQTQPRDPVDVKSYSTVSEALEDGAEYDLIVIDCPGYASPETIDIVRNSHLVVLPTSDSFDDVHPTLVLMDGLIKTGADRNRLAIAFCRLLECGDEQGTRKLMEEYGVQVLRGCIPERAAFRKASSSGLAITETFDGGTDAPVNALMEALLQKILAQLQLTKLDRKRHDKDRPA